MKEGRKFCVNSRPPSSNNKIKISPFHVTLDEIDDGVSLGSLSL